MRRNVVKAMFERFRDDLLGYLEGNQKLQKYELIIDAEPYSFHFVLSPDFLRRMKYYKVDKYRLVNDITSFLEDVYTSVLFCRRGYTTEEEMRNKLIEKIKSVWYKYRNYKGGNRYSFRVKFEVGDNMYIWKKLSESTHDEDVEWKVRIKLVPINLLFSYIYTQNTIKKKIKYKI